MVDAALAIGVVGLYLSDVSGGPALFNIDKQNGIPFPFAAAVPVLCLVNPTWRFW